MKQQGQKTEAESKKWGDEKRSLTDQLNAANSSLMEYVKSSYSWGGVCLCLCDESNVVFLLMLCAESDGIVGSDRSRVERWTRNRKNMDSNPVHCGLSL